MENTMAGVTLIADWAPKPGFKLGAKDIEGRQTYLGSQVWRNPRFEIREYEIPTPGPEEVVIEVKACGICGSDLHARYHCDEVADVSAEIGYDGMWVTETTHDPFLPVLLAAGRTTRLEVGTAIAVAFPRSPTHLAQVANDLQAHSQGRFILGLGSQVRAHVERRFSATWSRPVTRMRELVLAIQAVWRCWNDGEPLDFPGRAGHRMSFAMASKSLDRLPGDGLRVLAAENPARARALAESGDVEILVRALRDVGGAATAAQLKPKLEASIPGIDVGAFWKLSKDAIRSDARLDSSEAYRQVYRLAPEGAAAAGVALPQLQPKAAPQGLGLIRKFLREHPDVTQGILQRIQAQLSDVSAVAQEALSGVRVVRAYRQEAAETERFERANLEYLRRNRGLIALQGFFFPSMSFFLGLGAMLVLWLGSREVIAGRKWKDLKVLGGLLALFGALTLAETSVLTPHWSVRQAARKE